VRRIIPDEVKYAKILAKAEIFWTRVDKSNPDGCWPWLGAIDIWGYGFLNIKPTLIKSHRASWILTNGRMITSDEHVLHRCDNPPCCNPAHLFLGDNDMNVADMVAKGRQSKGEKSAAAARAFHQAQKAQDPDAHRLKFGRHSIGSRNANTNLADDDVRQILTLTCSTQETAALFGVGTTTIRNIRSGYTWRHVDPEMPRNPSRYERQPAGLRGAKNPGAKLTEDQVRQIRKLEGFSQSELGARFGVVQTIISRIIRREIWKHVTEDAPR
jgi:hypothetical protein